MNDPNDAMREEALRCAEVMARGGVILYPTDTVWGLGCDPMNAEAVRRIYEIKRRPADKSLILLASEAQLPEYVSGLQASLRQIAALTGKPTTVIYSEVKKLPEDLLQHGSIAIRVPDDPFCQAMIAQLGRPAVSTSANISGAPTPQTFAQIASEVREAVDHVAQYRQHDDTVSEPSAIVKLLADGTLEWIRK